MHAATSRDALGAPSSAFAGLRAELIARLAPFSLELPMLPAVAEEALRLVVDPAGDMRRLAELIHRDPAIAAHILRVASSPVYRGASARFVSLQQALSRLGTRAIGEIVLAICAKNKTFCVPGFEDEARALFEHSLASAFLARRAAKVIKANLEEAFLGGLLHDLGRLAILHYAASRMNGEARDHLPALRALADELHPRVGGAIAHAWSLPAAVADVARWHHDPESAPHAHRAVYLTAFADRCAHGLFDAPAFSLDELASAPSALALHLYPEDVALVVAEKDAIEATLRSLP